MFLVSNLVRGAVVVLAASGLLLAGTSPASANNGCGPDYTPNGYDYTFLETSGSFSGYYWSGIRSEISVPGSYLPVGPSDSHLLDYIGVRADVPQSECGGYTGSCMIQGGVGVGRISSAQANSSTLYVEREDVYGYVDLYYPGASIGTSDSYKITFSGITRVKDGVPIGEFDIYFDNHTGWGFQNFGVAWLPTYLYEQALTVLESQNQVHGYCPIVQPYEYYGDSGYPQVAYSPYGAGSGWTPASNSNSAFFLSPKYPAYELTVGDPARWKTEGN